ncbi:hypothetical protein QJS10_CPB19g01923 [Acorus calamus]|uniref:Uncharacterized protein n=1 Tax=Acorus calamus TaxID=4465 RepID=A0AAV9CFJ5_ACOCL|nr:hypothetical protein QJS10_CPB19g01923 [Acorus calamus]
MEQRRLAVLRNTSARLEEKGFELKMEYLMEMKHSLLSAKKNFTPSLEATPPHVVAAMSAKLPFLSNTIMKPVADTNKVAQWKPSALRIASRNRSWRCSKQEN